MKLIIVRVICVLLIVAAVGLYAYGVLVNGEAPLTTFCARLPSQRLAQVR